MRHVVMFSGGVGSWAAAKRVAEAHGTEQLTLLFTDTRLEDADLYRFVIEAAAHVENIDAADLAARASALPSIEDDEEAFFAALTPLQDATNTRIPYLRWIADGRSVWELFVALRMMGNTQVDHCSRVLKRELADKYKAQHFSPDDTTVYVGIDWSEIHRFDREPGTRNPKDKGGLKQRKAAAGWTYKAPLRDPPYLTKRDLLRQLQAEGIRPPRLYELGFAHNNCGGFCIKAGFGHYANLLRTMPKRYAFHEAKEQAFREMVGRDDIAIMKRQPNRKKGDSGEYVPVTLRAFREEIEAGGQADMFDIGGCGCFMEASE